MDKIKTIIDDEYCVYVLKLQPVWEYQNLFKFGITSNITQRLQQHMRNLRYVETIAIIQCVNEKQMRYIETVIKRTAENLKERVNVMGNTELINTDHITTYIAMIKALAHLTDGIDTSNQECIVGDHTKCPNCNSCTDDLLEFIN